jgi:DNA-binding CsgD family transcriptional regulator
MAVRAGADCLEQARADRDLEAEAAVLRQVQQLPGLRELLRPDPFTVGPMSSAADADRATWDAEWTRLRGASDPLLWKRAATAWDALTRPHRSAYCRWRQAEAMLARPGRRATASPVLRIAAAQAAQHAPLAAAVADLARRARIELAPPARASVACPLAEAGHPFGLTDRELAVLQLLVAGRTNNEIGATLLISTRTASVHVTNILRKLHVTSRVQAATVAERARLW